MSNNRDYSLLQDAQDRSSPRNSPPRESYTHHFPRAVKKKNSWLTCINIFFVSCLVFLLFFQIALGNLISEKDAKAVAYIQRTFNISKYSSDNMTPGLYFFYALCYIFSDWILLIITIFIFLTFDPVLGFKFANAIYFMFYFTSLLQLFYTEPHAFWAYDDIQGVVCPQHFAEPATIAMGCMVFWWYFIFIFFFRYQVCFKTSKVIVISLAVVINLLVGFGLVLMGLHLFIHIVVTWVWASLYVILLIKFDTTYHDFMTKTGFILKKTKRKVFVVFFVCLALLAFSIVVLHCVEALADPNINWILQIQKNCQINLNSFKDIIGVDYSFYDTSFLMGIIGAAFGASLAVNCIPYAFWWRTNVFFRIIRGIIGGALTFGLYKLFGLVKQIDLSTNWFFNYSLPIGISCFLCMGILPILFNYTFLSKKRPIHLPLEEENFNNYPDLSSDDTLMSPQGPKRGLTSLREAGSDEEMPSAPESRRETHQRRLQSKQMSLDDF